MKIKGGEIVGEPLDLYIKTDKPILPKLGDKDNPMYAIYHEKLSAEDYHSARSLATFSCLHWNTSYPRT